MLRHGRTGNGSSGNSCRLACSPGCSLASSSAMPLASTWPPRRAAGLIPSACALRASASCRPQGAGVSSAPAAVSRRSRSILAATSPRRGKSSTPSWILQHHRLSVLARSVVPVSATRQPSTSRRDTLVVLRHGPAATSSAAGLLQGLEPTYENHQRPHQLASQERVHSLTNSLGFARASRRATIHVESWLQHLCEIRHEQRRHFIVNHCTKSGRPRRLVWAKSVSTRTRSGTRFDWRTARPPNDPIDEAFRKC